MITGSCDKFETVGTIQNANKSRMGRTRSSSNNESVATVLQAFTRSPKKSARQCSRETGGPRTRVHRILRHEKWKPYVPRQLHAVNEDYPGRVEIYEWFLHIFDGREYFSDLFGPIKPLLNVTVLSINTTVCTGPPEIHV
jgi:hypothetical protein